MGGVKGIDFWRGSEALIVLTEGEKEEIEFGRGRRWSIGGGGRGVAAFFVERVPFGFGIETSGESCLEGFGEKDGMIVGGEKVGVIEGIDDLAVDFGELDGFTIGRRSSVDIVISLVPNS